MDKYRYNLALQEENRIAAGNLNHKPSLYGWIKELIEGYCADLREKPWGKRWMYLKNNNEYVRKKIKENVGIPDDKIDQLVHYETFNEDEWTVKEMYGYINKILNMWYKLCRDEFKYSYGDDREKHYEELWFKKVHRYTEIDIYEYAKLFDLGMVWASMYYGRKAY